MESKEYKAPVDIERWETAGSEISIPDAQREYLISKHGTAELDPMPDANDKDPLNWRKSKKIVMLALVAFHAMMATFTAAAIQSAFVNIAEDLHVSIQDASYLTSLVIAILGGAPLFWRPLADRYGRLPIFTFSLIGSLVCNIGCANSPHYGSMAACRALVAFFISPAAAIGSAVVAELFFKSERARYMGVWTLMVTIGVPVSPFIFGFVALRVNYRWIYYILAITNAVQFVLYVLFGSETLYMRNSQAPAEANRGRFASLFTFRRLNLKPLSALDFIRPLRFFALPCVLLAAVSYAMIFEFANILPTILIPQLYVEKFQLNTQEVGLQNIAIIIGSVIGELIGGRISDYWMQLGTNRHGGHRPHAEFRLWLSYLAIPLAIIGTSIFLVFIDEAGSHWTVVPDVGAAVAATGNQIATTVLITYAVDCYREDAAGVGVFITFVRQIWGFIGPFWFPQMIASVGLKGSAGIAAGIVAGVCFPATILLQWKGMGWRSKVRDHS